MMQAMRLPFGDFTNDFVGSSGFDSIVLGLLELLKHIMLQQNIPYMCTSAASSHYGIFPLL